MESSAAYGAPERLSAFFDQTTAFLRAVAETPSLGTHSERVALAAAVAELDEIQLPRANRELRDRRDGEDFESAGFTVEQAEFKLAAAERAMTEAIEPTPTGWIAPTAILRAVAKIKVILGSIKSLSKWLEALDELVSMTGELAKNRLPTARRE